MKLGKRPAKSELLPKLKFGAFIDKAALPKPPKAFGHEALIPPKGWGMLGNDTVGDCVIASAAHRSFLSNKIAGRDIAFSAENVLKTYSEITGYDPAQTDKHGNNPTDQGTDMPVAAGYWRHTGILDAKGERHTVRAYLSLKAGDLQELWLASWLFDGNVDVGVMFPDYAMDQFNAGKPWTYRRLKAQPNEGHCIQIVAHRGTRTICTTWGQTQPITGSFLTHYNDETIAYVTDECLTNNKSPEGFDADGLIAALNGLKPA